MVATVAVCRAEEVDLGRAQVLAGHAVAFGGYYQDEAAARDARRGLWAGISSGRATGGRSIAAWRRASPDRRR